MYQGKETVGEASLAELLTIETLRRLENNEPRFLPAVDVPLSSRVDPRDTDNADAMTGMFAERADTILRAEYGRGKSTIAAVVKWLVRVWIVIVGLILAVETGICGHVLLARGADETVSLEGFGCPSRQVARLRGCDRCRLVLSGQDVGTQSQGLFRSTGGPVEDARQTQGVAERWQEMNWLRAWLVTLTPKRVRRKQPCPGIRHIAVSKGGMGLSRLELLKTMWSRRLYGSGRSPALVLVKYGLRQREYCGKLRLV